MPFTRLLDCRMDYADATALHARTAAGDSWGVVSQSASTTIRVPDGIATDKIEAASSRGFGAPT
ncbi:hypothetical protein C6P97_31435 [Burkholderia multivorans]|uniref:Uncharacterized protein n=1 Tax=Burkholderia multivorans TaxID=87883 RepID=A0AB37AY31_9BURK|nr:hypothetical protein C6P97_31435 [Burkholderia multivorans]PRE53068.1 hypothetical protein C6P99_06335 [Burkholderia multivorans]